MGFDPFWSHIFHWCGWEKKNSTLPQKCLDWSWKDKGIIKGVVHLLLLISNHISSEPMLNWIFIKKLQIRSFFQTQSLAFWPSSIFRLQNPYTLCKFPVFIWKNQSQSIHPLKVWFKRNKAVKEEDSLLPAPLLVFERPEFYASEMISQRGLA